MAWHKKGGGAGQTGVKPAVAKPKPPAAPLVPKPVVTKGDKTAIYTEKNKPHFGGKKTPVKKGHVK